MKNTVNWYFGNHKDDNVSEEIWIQKLTNWLESCKDIKNVTQEVLKEWDEILNGDSVSNEIINSFCRFSGLKKGKPLGN